MSDLDPDFALVVEPLTITLQHDLTFARVYRFSIGYDEERVTVPWRPGHPHGERALAQRADEFARRHLGAWLRAHAPSAHEFVGMGRIAFAHACDALTFRLRWGEGLRPGA